MLTVYPRLCKAILALRTRFSSMKVLDLDAFARYLRRVLFEGKGILLTIIVPRRDGNEALFEVEKDLIIIEREVKRSEHSKDWGWRLAEVLGTVTIGSVAMAICNAGRKKLELVLEPRNDSIRMEDVVKAIALCAAMERGIRGRIRNAVRVASYASSFLGTALFLALQRLGLPIPRTNDDFLNVLLYATLSLGIAFAINVCTRRIVAKKLFKEFNEEWNSIARTSLIETLRRSVEIALSFAEKCRGRKASTTVAMEGGLLNIDAKHEVRKRVSIVETRIRIATPSKT